LHHFSVELPEDGTIEGRKGGGHVRLASNCQRCGTDHKNSVNKSGDRVAPPFEILGSVNSTTITKGSPTYIVHAERASLMPDQFDTDSKGYKELMHKAGLKHLTDSVHATLMPGEEAGSNTRPDSVEWRFKDRRSATLVARALDAVIPKASDSHRDKYGYEDQEHNASVSIYDKNHNFASMVDHTTCDDHKQEEYVGSFDNISKVVDRDPSTRVQVDDNGVRHLNGVPVDERGKKIK
jgi:hypothetical protein